MRATSHLQNDELYCRLDEDPTDRYAEEITSIFKSMTDREVIDKETFDYLRPQNSQTSHFYILPKIHKEGVPARLIVSSCECHTEKISQFVDYHLPTLVTSIPSYIKDATDFLPKFKSIGKVPPGSLLLT